MGGKNPQRLCFPFFRVKNMKVSQWKYLSNLTWIGKVIDSFFFLLPQTALISDSVFWFQKTSYEFIGFSVLQISALYLIFLIFFLLNWNMVDLLAADYLSSFIYLISIIQINWKVTSISRGIESIQLSRNKSKREWRNYFMGWQTLFSILPWLRLKSDYRRHIFWLIFGENLNLNQLLLTRILWTPFWGSTTTDRTAKMTGSPTWTGSHWAILRTCRPSRNRATSSTNSSWLTPPSTASSTSSPR